MSSYRIKSGDTMSAIARRNHTSVGALMKANPTIKNANLIIAGKTLNIPGSRDSFEHRPARPAGGGRPGGTGGTSGGRPTQQTQGTGGTGPASQGPKGSPFDIARSQLDKNAGSLKLEKNGVGSDMEDWVPNNVNCANFVSACLEQAGQIKNGQHSNSVYGLQGNLDKDPNFKRVSLAQAKPGDVVCMKTPGGQHVVMYAGMKNGRPEFIGSNNINKDGSQRISFSQMNYPIMSIHQYRG
jgi:LysM repeat protein